MLWICPKVFFIFHSLVVLTMGEENQHLLKISINYFLKKKESDSISVGSRGTLWPRKILPELVYLYASLCRPTVGLWDNLAFGVSLIHWGSLILWNLGPIFCVCFKATQVNDQNNGSQFIEVRRCKGQKEFSCYKASDTVLPFYPSVTLHAVQWLVGDLSGPIYVELGLERPRFISLLSYEVQWMTLG